VISDLLVKDRLKKWAKEEGDRREKNFRKAEARRERWGW
jgi:hypothetical protein